MTTLVGAETAASERKMKAQRPCRHQFRKRLYTVFQFPRSGGRSRQGMPVLATQMTESTKRRFPSFDGRPTPEGHRGPILAHWASVSR